MKVLVTGGAGFIGSHICTLLLQNNYKLTIVDSFVNSSLGSIKKIEKLGIKNKKRSIRQFQEIKSEIR